MVSIAALSTTPANITASGSSATTSPIVTSVLNLVSSPTNGTSGIALPICADSWNIGSITEGGATMQGEVQTQGITIKNLGPNSINVYPQGSDSLVAGTVIPPWAGFTYSSGGSGRGWLAEPVIN